jgi:hypothetical protein
MHKKKVPIEIKTVKTCSRLNTGTLFGWSFVNRSIECHLTFSSTAGSGWVAIFELFSFLKYFFSIKVLVLRTVFLPHIQYLRSST